MKKSLQITLLVLLTFVCTLQGVTTNQSSLYGDSFIMRVKGAEALYWNPSLINPEYRDILLPGINQSFHIANNAFSVDTYNFINGSYLSESDKDKIMDKIKNRLAVNAESHTTVFGISFSNLAIASSVHLVTQAQLSRKYIQLLLYGNAEDDYVFDKKYNQASGLAYQDFTLGIGNVCLNDLTTYDKLPDIYFGASGSLLAGYGVFNTKKYYGSFHTGIDGMSLDQEIKLGTGTGGAGFKSMIGLSSQPTEDLSVGISLDNIFGSIRWFAKTEDLTYSAFADSVYLSDLEDDIITQTDSVHKISPFNTDLPPELRLGALYDLGPASVSADWVQGFRNSNITSSIGRLSIAGEFLPTPAIPLSLGISFGNSDYPWRVSYGIGLRTSHITAGIGFQTFKAVDLFGLNSRGVSFSSYLTVLY